MKAIVFGAGHGIGYSLSLYLSRIGYGVVATYRKKENASDLLSKSEIKSFQLDPLNRDSLNSLVDELKGIEFDLFINCIGVLTIKSSPEKNIRALNLETMEEVFRVNTFITPLLVQAFKKNISRIKETHFVVLSAKVGSIEDNNIGGWYSYRASKTALNMFMKNFSNEFRNLKIPCKFLSIHPGTTHTELSKNYLKGIKHTVWSSDDTARHIFEVIQNSKNYTSGDFVNWDGSVLPW